MTRRNQYDVQNARCFQHIKSDIAHACSSSHIILHARGALCAQQSRLVGEQFNLQSTRSQSLLLVVSELVVQVGGELRETPPYLKHRAAAEK
jgi:hypothetical protein